VSRLAIPVVPATAALRFIARLTTRWSDEDNLGVLNNAVYLTLFEEARWRYFGSLGLLQQGNFPFLLAQCNVRFLHPGRGGAEVDVALATTRIGNTSLQQAYRVVSSTGQQAWCEAEALLVVTDDAGRPIPIPAAFRAAVMAFEGSDLG
jgi:acyl-CoA thioester hydrolase